MQKFFYFIAVFLLILSGCKTNEKNKDNIDVEEFSQDYFFPEEMAYYSNITESLPDKFYPIGWSKDGNFAYIIEPADEALGNYMMGLVIMSTISNEVLWDWYTQPEVTEDLYREEVWQKNYKKIKEQLNKYKIIQRRDMKLVEPYFNYKDKDYVVWLETKKIKDHDMGVELVGSSTLYIKSPDLGQKKIIEKKYEDSMILNQQISGCIISPYEDRIAVVVKSERMGYEGPPNILEFQIFGTNLTTSFKKD